MMLYAREDEERIRAQAQIRAWGQANLLSGAQTKTLETELRVDVRRTTALIRAGLALFTALVVISSVLLIGVVVNVHTNAADAFITAVAAVACFAAAEYLVRALRLYRHGVEEALAVFSILLAAFTALFAFNAVVGRNSNASIIASQVVGCAGGFGIYRRFGYVYAVFLSMVFAALVPFSFDMAESAQRLISAGIMATVFGLVRTRLLADGDDYPGDDYATMQAAAWAVMYLALNVQAWELIRPFFGPPGHTHAWFYWGSYVAIWAIPAIGLRLGIRQRDREFIDVNIVLALATLVTNKPYLGWPRHEWDPMILGVLLMAFAIALRRWLASGPDGARSGFTPAQLLATDANLMSMVGTASTAFHPHVASPSSPPGDDFRGGRSGGAGGGASF